MSEWSVYILRCADTSLYTGISTDVRRRIAQHNTKKGAAYTRSRTPVTLIWEQGGLTESEARKKEAEIKTWTKADKEAFLHPKR
jgi:putative endonuclease